MRRIGLKFLSGCVAATVALGAVLATPVHAQAVGATSNHLRDALVAQIALERGDFRVSVNEIGGAGRFVSIGGDDSVEPASSIKLFYAWAVLDRADRGKLSLSRRLPSGPTWGQCMKVMIELSDNLCSADIREALGNGRLNRAFRNEGFSSTRILLDEAGQYAGKRTSTADLTTLLTRLEAGSLLSPQSSRHFHNLLRNQIWRSRIAAGTPQGTVVESKPGELAVDSKLVQTDAAIVRGPVSTYVVTIMAERGATKRALKRLSRIVFEGLQGVTGYESAEYPPEQYTLPAGSSFRTTYGGAAIRLRAAHTVTVQYSLRRDVYVDVSGVGLGWVPFTQLRLRDAYRWLE